MAAKPPGCAPRASFPPIPGYESDFPMNTLAGPVQFDAVQKTYDGTTMVVQDLDLKIPAGEFLTLLGPSGSGKTTSLMMLAGFEAPTAGHILVGGKQIESVPPHKRNIGMVFQNYALFPHMTVAENLAYALRVRKVPRSEISARVARALDMVQMTRFAERHPTQLSGGQQQRVALARAVIFEPGVVLMDEPLGALDKNLREHLQYEIKALHARLGVTVVYVTHDQGEALTMSDRIAVFNRGRIEQIAPPAQIYEFPATRFVAEFIGETNMLAGRAMGDGQVDIRGARLHVTDSGGRGAAPVTLSLRPERISLGPDAADLENRLIGTVADVIYHGDTMRVLVDIAGGQRLICKMRNRGGGGTLQKDQSVIMGFERTAAVPIWDR